MGVDRPGLDTSHNRVIRNELTRHHHAQRFASLYSGCATRPYAPLAACRLPDVKWESPMNGRTAVLLLIVVVVGCARSNEADELSPDASQFVDEQPTAQD